MLNELDCPKYSRDKLTTEVTKSFQDHLQNRLFYINNVNGLLIARKINLNPNKALLKELKDGTSFDFFINIKARKNKSDFSVVELYQNENTIGANQSEVILEIYDLNLSEIIYSQQVIGSDSPKKESSVWASKKSDKLIDNIAFYRTSNKLMLGSLKKILKDLKKKSITI